MFWFNARLCVSVAVLASVIATASRAQDAGDTAFKSMQSRGRMAMGVDQYTSTHRFEDLPDGGRMKLQRNRPDSAGVEAIERTSAGDCRCLCQGRFRCARAGARRGSSGSAHHGCEAPGYLLSVPTATTRW